MKLPAFAHHRARSVPDACAVLAEHGDEARVLAGGQSLLPRMARRLTTPRVLVDITDVDELRTHEVGAGAVTVGAGATTRRLETAPDLRDAHPLVGACLAHSGHVEIRNRGTACGSLGHADPASEVPALALALDGTVVVTSARGERRIPAADHLVGPYTTALAPDEMITALDLPTLPLGAGWSIREIARRDGDFALVGVVTVLGTSDDGRCSDARVALFGVAGTAVRARATERALVDGGPPTDTVVDDAAALAFDGLEVTTDIQASAAYRRRAGTRLVARSLREARDRCRTGDAVGEAARA